MTTGSQYRQYNMERKLTLEASKYTGYKLSLPLHAIVQISYSIYNLLPWNIHINIHTPIMCWCAIHAKS